MKYIIILLGSLGAMRLDFFAVILAVIAVTAVLALVVKVLYQIVLRL